MEPQVNKHEEHRLATFSQAVDFSQLKYVVGALYNTQGSKFEIPKYASNSISTHSNLTAMAFELVTEVFSLQHIDENAGVSDIVLDVGCGEPALFNLMANSMIFPNYVGIDIRDEALAQYPNNKNCVVINDDITTSTIIRPDSVKVVNFTEVLEHVTKESGIKILESIFRVLVKDGVMILTTPIKPKAISIDMAKEESKWDHITYYEYDDLIKTIESVGFSVKAYYFNKFIGMRSTYQAPRKAMIEKYGEAGQEIFDQVKAIWGQRVAGSIFANHAGDRVGHIQLIAVKC